MKRVVFVCTAIVLLAVGLALLRYRPGRHHQHRPRLKPTRATPLSPQPLESHDTGAPPTPSAQQEKAGDILFARSVLEHVYQDSRPRPEEQVSALSLQAARDEYEPVQVAVHALRDLKQMNISVSDLESDANQMLAASAVQVRMVRYYGARLSFRAPNQIGVVPKTLEPAVPIDIAAGTTRPYWITVHIPKNQAGGVYHGSITFAHASGASTLDLSLEVLPTALDEPDCIYGTLCLNALGALAKPHARNVQNILREADIMFHDQREHGMNSISLWSGNVYHEQEGHPYLPDLEVAMQLYQRYGFSKPLVYLPVNLLKTNKLNRSSNYKQYDPAVHIAMARDIASYYTQRFREAGLPGILFIPVEEPSLRTGISWWQPADTRQKMTHDLTKAIKETGALTALTCTPQSVRCASEYLDYWIMAYHKFSPGMYKLARDAHAKLGLYANETMMGNGTYFTRFLFGYFVWANDLKAMLPWTYPLHPKRFPRNLENRGEGGLNVQDGFLGLDGEPVPTIQWELSREGIDDAKYLVTIERLARQAREKGTAAGMAAADEADTFLSGVRKAVRPDVRRYVFEDQRTLEPAGQDGWDAAKFENTKRRAFEVLKKLLAAE